MKRIVELPLLEPLYSTYQRQGPATATIFNNPSIRNWYFNKILMLTCTRKFLNGLTTPEMGIIESNWNHNPYFDQKFFDIRFLGGYTHHVIKKLLDDGYYVCFEGFDDYYIEGKSWYHEKHFFHDGCICGYNQNDKTYCIYSYDQTWVYRKFWATQESFDASMKATLKQKQYASICGLKPTDEPIPFSSDIALEKIKEYLDSSYEKYPETEDGLVFGSIVHNYIARYVEKLYDGSIPYDRMDRRVLRMIWEHKKVMLERIKLIEQALSLDSETSDAYISIVKDADTARMLYATHHMKRRDSVLPIISKTLRSIKDREYELLTTILQKSEGEKQR